MSAGRGPHPERLMELLADRAMHGLSHEEAAELERLLAAEDPLDVDSFDRAAAAADLAFSGGHPSESLPGHLVNRIQASGLATLTRATTGTSAVPAAAASARGGGGAAPTGQTPPGRRGLWLALAASLAVAAAGWWVALSPSSPPDAKQTRAAVLAAGDRLEWTWSAWAPKPAGEGGEPFPLGQIGGEVSWSTREQAGVMRFVGLPRNDPRQLQYQLWIIDPAQKHPIDGGVFDVSGDGEVLVRIDPKIRVSGVAAFAITAEKPGGVVVSDQNRRVIIAAAPPSKG